MDPDFCIAEALSDPQFKTYFFNLLSSDLPDEEKYARLVDYFRTHGDDQNWQFELGAPVRSSEKAAETGFPTGWDVDSILVQTADSIRRAVQRINRSQHQDGGWGIQYEVSNFWHTAYAVLCLSSARRCAELVFDVDFDALLQSGFTYIEQHPENWATDIIEPEGSLSVYDLCLMVRSFFHGGREFLRRETMVRVYRGIEHLYHAQNLDGGWDASLWGFAALTPVRQFSEVGATSAAMQALAEVCDDRFVPSMQSAGRWLAATQNIDGSWNNGSTRPDLGAFILTGDPRINKTCDAVQGILAQRAFDLPVNSYPVVIGRAVDWIQRKEAPVLDKKNRVSGWAWGYHPADYDNTCMALETLLKLPNAPLPLLAANAGWLVQNQRRQEGDLEDGSWVLGHTARITLALIEYYRKIQGVARSVETFRQWFP